MLNHEKEVKGKMLQSLYRRVIDAPRVCEARPVLSRCARHVPVRLLQVGMVVDVVHHCAVSAANWCRLDLTCTNCAARAVNWCRLDFTCKTCATSGGNWCRLDLAYMSCDPSAANWCRVNWTYCNF